MLNNAELYTMTNGTILYNSKHCYMYSGTSDGTHYYFYLLDDNEDAEGEPDTVLTKSEVKRLNRL